MNDYKSFYAVYWRAWNIEMLSTQWRIQGRDPGASLPPPPLFLDQTETRRAEKIFLSPGTPPHLSQGLDDRPEVNFLWESIDWARNKWSLSALLGVRIERVEFTENVRAFPRDKENCP